MSPSFRLLFLTCPLLVGASLPGAVVLDDLVKSSPFMPGDQESSAVVAPTENATVEFRGMITTKDGMLFGLYDRTKQIGAWVRKEDKDADFVVQSYDEASDLVVVNYHGQKFNLTLSSAKIATAAPSAPPSLPVAGQTGTQAPGGAAVVRVDDQRRLESIAAEVRRRRALRQGNGGGAAAQPVQAAPVQADGTRR